MGQFSFSLNFHYLSFCDSYPPRYIHSRFMKFFIKYLPISSILPLLNNDKDFLALRRQLLNEPTIAEHQIASRLAKTIDVNSTEKVVNDVLDKTPLDKQLKWNTNLIIHYTYERRLSTYKKDIHQLWNQIFKQTPVPIQDLLLEIETVKISLNN